MDHEQWQAKRKELGEVERKERQQDWQRSRAPLQASITEQAVRELYDRVTALEEHILRSKK